MSVCIVKKRESDLWGWEPSILTTGWKTLSFSIRIPNMDFPSTQKEKKNNHVCLLCFLRHFTSLPTKLLWWTFAVDAVISITIECVRNQRFNDVNDQIDTKLIAWCAANEDFNYKYNNHPHNTSSSSYHRHVQRWGFNGCHNVNRWLVSY